MPTQRLVMTLNQRKRRQPHAPTQRLVIAISQRKRRQPHVLTQRHVIALNRRKKSLLHVHVYSSKKESICAFRRDKYALSEFKSVTREAYIKDLINSLLSNPEIK